MVNNMPILMGEGTEGGSGRGRESIMKVEAVVVFFMSG